MKIDIISLFPEMFRGPFDESIIKRAQEKGLVEIAIHDLRKWGIDQRKTVDDRPYGGGAGMVLMIEPIFKALKQLRAKDSQVVLLTPQGKMFDQQKAQQLSRKHLILIAGHYEGFDERIREHLVDEEVSIGDYVLTGGELPAMVITDAVVRLIPGVLKKEEATINESFSPVKTDEGEEKSLLEYPQYTRPENFQGWKVPKILLSGNHPQIDKWRLKKAIEKTRKKRPDLL